MCTHDHETKTVRRGFLKALGNACLGLIGFLIGAKGTEAAEVCGAKCISSPYDGGTCDKPKRPFHQFHRCSKGHTW